MRDSKGRFIKGSNEMQGRHHSEATKEKLRQQHLGKPLSESHKKAIAKGNKGGNSGSFKKGLIPKNKGKGAPIERDLICSVCKKVWHWKAKIMVRKDGYIQNLNVTNPPKTCSKECRYKSCSLKEKGKERPHMQGKNAYQWKGGIRNLYKVINQSAMYAQYRLDCFKRDNFTCILCNKRGSQDIQADHYPVSFAKIIEKNNIKTLEQAMDCKELWNMDNIRTLCISCHKKTDTYGKPVRLHK